MALSCKCSTYGNIHKFVNIEIATNDELNEMRSFLNKLPHFHLAVDFHDAALKSDRYKLAEIVDDDNFAILIQKIADATVTRDLNGDHRCLQAMNEVMALTCPQHDGLETYRKFFMHALTDIVKITSDKTFTNDLSKKSKADLLRIIEDLKTEREDSRVQIHTLRADNLILEARQKKELEQLQQKRSVKNFGCQTEEPLKKKFKNKDSQTSIAVASKNTQTVKDSKKKNSQYEKESQTEIVMASKSVQTKNDKNSATQMDKVDKEIAVGNQQVDEPSQIIQVSDETVQYADEHSIMESLLNIPNAPASLAQILTTEEMQTVNDYVELVQPRLDTLIDPISQDGSYQVLQQVSPKPMLPCSADRIRIDGKTRDYTFDYLGYRHPRPEKIKIVVFCPKEIKDELLDVDLMTDNEYLSLQSTLITDNMEIYKKYKSMRHVTPIKIVREYESSSSEMIIKYCQGASDILRHYIVSQSLIVIDELYYEDTLQWADLFLAENESENKMVQTEERCEHTSELRNQMLAFSHHYTVDFNEHEGLQTFSQQVRCDHCS